MELDRIAEDFKSLHAERQKLLRQWQETIEAMKRRDEEINAIGKERVSQVVFSITFMHGSGG